MVHLIYSNPTQPVFVQNIFAPFRAHANVKIIYGHVDIGVLRLSFSIFWQIFFRVRKQIYVLKVLEPYGTVQGHK